jgi:hypothetical protein
LSSTGQFEIRYSMWTAEGLGAVLDGKNITAAGTTVIGTFQVTLVE